MRIKNTDEITAHVTNYYSDGSALYVVFHSKSSISLVIYDPDSFKKVSVLKITPLVLTHLNPCLDNDCIYLPTTEGQIFGNDKFNGTRLVTMELGPMIPVTDLQQNDNLVFSCCGLPIKEVKKPKTNTDLFCIVINEKENGKKIFQSQYFKGSPSFVNDKDNLYVSANSNLFQFTDYGELVNAKSLGVECEFEPLITNDFVICSSSMGTLEILRKADLTLHRRILVEKTTSPPVCNDEFLYWFTNKSVFRVNLQTVEKEEIVKIASPVTAVPILKDNKLYTTDVQGSVISVDLNERTIDYKKVSIAALSKLVMIDELLFVASNTQLFQLDTTK